jgi:hypothetical protein
MGYATAEKVFAAKNGREHVCDGDVDFNEGNILSVDNKIGKTV